MVRFLQIDAAHGEGGGQVVRTAVALAAITGTAIDLGDIRAHRTPAGLAPQHLAAIRAVASLCAGTCEGLERGSRTLRFIPGPIAGGDFCFDIGTAGSITLLLQALVPVLLRADRTSWVRVIGGTDIRAAPPIDYFRLVLVELIRRMGARIGFVVRRRGYYPRGGGEVEVTVAPAALRPFRASSSGPLLGIDGIAHVGNLPLQIARRMRTAAVAALGASSTSIDIDEQTLGRDQAIGTGGAIVLRVRTQATLLGAGRVAERGVLAETLGADAGHELAEDMGSGASVDTHAADQLLVYCALAEGISEFRTRQLSSHAITAMWLIQQFLPVRFDVSEGDGLMTVRMFRDSKRGGGDAGAPPRRGRAVGAAADLRASAARNHS